MDKVSGHTRLYRRGAIYYFRAKVPQDLLKYYAPKKEIKFSLNTTDPRRAAELVVEASVKQNAEFAAYRAGKSPTKRQGAELTPEQIRTIGHEWLTYWLEQDEAARARGLSDAQWESIEAWTTEFGDEWRTALAAGDTRETTGEAEARIAELLPAGVSPTTETVRRVAFELLKQRVEYWNAICDRQRGDFSTSHQAPTKAAPVPAGQPGALTLGQAFDRWNAERKLPEKTLAEWRRIHARFAGMHGDLPVNAITKAQAVAFKDALVREGKAPGTIIKQVNAVGVVLGWAVSNGYLQSNPAAGIKVASRKKPGKARVAFDSEDLQRIFDSPVFATDRRPKGGGGLAAYWLPLLALYTGARVEELAQLLTSDVREEDGSFVVHFAAAEGQKKLKTQSSQRRVPVHPELIRLGFLRYVEATHKAAHVRLFPQLVPDKWGHFSGNWSKWWGRYLRKAAAITDARKVFHSFRHTFKDACRRAGISEEVHDALTGHSGGGEGRGYGGEAFPLPPLREAIAKIAYSGLVLRRRGAHAGEE